MWRWQIFLSFQDTVIDWIKRDRNWASSRPISLIFVDTRMMLYVFDYDMHDAVFRDTSKSHTHSMQRINVQPLASPRKPWIRQEAAAKLGNRNDGSASRTPIRKRSGKAGYDRTNDGSFSFFFHDWSRDRDAIFFFFSLLITAYDKHARSHYQSELTRLIATENKLIATHKLKDQSVNWILQLLAEALSTTASTGVDPLSRASSSCNQSRTCRDFGCSYGFRLV